MGMLESKIAIITGAAAGMGRESALLFAREGATIVAADVADEGGEETAALVRQAGGRATYRHADVSSANDVEALVRAAVQAHGRLDIMFNNAGIEGRSGVLVEDVEEDDWDRILAINLKGIFLGMKYALPELVKTRGVVINTASLAGLIGVPGMAAYTASKGGVVQLTKAAALEYARAGVRINCICPGYIATDMTRRLREHERDPRLPERLAPVPMHRPGTPGEIAKAALYLASDLASFVTGTALTVDGGSLAE